MPENQVREEDKDFKLVELGRSPSEYVLDIKNLDYKIMFPSGTLEEVATSDREHGKDIIRTLSNSPFLEEKLKKQNLNYDSIIAFTTKAYLKYVQDFQDWKKSQTV